MWILCPLILYKGNPSSNHKMHLSKQFLFEFELRHQTQQCQLLPEIVNLSYLLTLENYMMTMVWNSC